MKALIKTLAIAFVCGAMALPSADAQSRGERNGSRGGQSTSVGTSNGGGVGRGQAATAVRPGSSNTRPGNNQGNVGPGTNYRPGNTTQPGAGHQPGNVGPGNNYRPGGSTQPGVGHQPTHQPGHQPVYGGHGDPGHGHGPDHGYNPGPRPGIPGPGIRPEPGRRPPTWMPAPRPWVAPRPPMGWRPGPVVPTFSTILGMNFGIGINFSLNYLLNNGYTVYSYGNNAVYLNNVNQLNMIWPDATLYYGAGGLTHGEFIYYTPYYDTYRYNLAYSRLVATYGNPIMTSYPTNGMQTQWFGYDGRFVTLTYQPMYGDDGILRYYTTLTFGM